jgi:light-regulated signal transduction histidine kinase (bacteriophytochrome)
MEDLKRSNQELEQFAYVASHDLQEPLRMVASFTQLLQKRYKDKLDQDANEFIYYAVDGATRMQSLINDLLKFSRVGTQGKQFKATDMNVVLDKVKLDLSQLIFATKANIIIEALPVIMADDSQMMQLFQNLLSNAIKFRGERSPRIHISSEVKQDEWIFSVRDNGIGIESKDFDKIFEIFQRLHNEEEYEGSGIGLAICKKIVQRHGGKIWVESKLNEGTTFYFSIPKDQKIKEQI